MNIYVSNSFSDAWHYVPILLVSAVYSAIASYYGSFYSALKRSINNMLTTLIGGIINIMVNYVFIRITGIWGAAIGTAVAYIVIALLRMIDVGKMIAIRVNWKIFALNSFIIIAYSILVSLDIMILPGSIAVIVLFVIFNHNEIRYAINKTQGLLKRG